MKKIIEQAMADTDRLGIEQHKNLLGDKYRYINNISEALSKDYVRKDQLYIDEDMVIDIVLLYFGRGIEIKKCEEIAMALNKVSDKIIKSREDL